VGLKTAIKKKKRTVGYKKKHKSATDKKYLKCIHLPKSDLGRTDQQLPHNKYGITDTMHVHRVWKKTNIDINMKCTNETNQLGYAYKKCNIR
jgi:hypothetical protein